MHRRERGETSRTFGRVCGLLTTVNVARVMDDYCRGFAPLGRVTWAETGVVEVVGEWVDHRRSFLERRAGGR